MLIFTKLSSVYLNNWCVFLRLLITKLIKHFSENCNKTRCQTTLNYGPLTTCCFDIIHLVTFFPIHKQGYQTNQYDPILTVVYWKTLWYLQKPSILYGFLYNTLSTLWTLMATALALTDGTVSFIQTAASYLEVLGSTLNRFSGLHGIVFDK